MAFGGALQDGEPTLNNFNLLERVISILSKHESDELRPHTFNHNGAKFSYYLYTISIIGRCPTVAGIRNIVFCYYVRSSAYVNQRTSNAKGHRFLLCLTDKPTVDFFIRVEASLEEIALSGSRLSVGPMKLDLTMEWSFRLFKRGGW